VKVFVPMLASHAKVRDHDLLEKDVRLHLLLEAIVADKTVGPDVFFKGGTCLIKCYLDYPRFSTDLDFTWRLRHAWRSLGTKPLRRALRPVQRTFLDRLETHASAQGLRFDEDRDVQYGQSNRMMTVILRYESILRLPSAVKVQVNFVEPLLRAARRIEAQGLLQGGLPVSMNLLDSDLPARYSRPVLVEAYDPAEILAEKGRAVLTRTAAKTRDLLDLYLLENRLGLLLEEHREDIVKKTTFSVLAARRYRDRLAEADQRFDLLLEEDVKPLLLKPIDDAAFESFRVRAIEFFGSIVEELRELESKDS